MTLRKLASLVCLAALVALTVTATSLAADKADKPAVQTVQKFQKDITSTDPKTGEKATKAAEMTYLLYLPDGYDKDAKDATKKWPLVLFLHGAGERGDDIEKVKIHGPPKLVEQGKKFPFILVSPQCSAKGWWPTEVLEGLLDEVTAKYAVDKDRLYVTGLSMGGFATWNLGCDQPDRFAALVPICGGGDPTKAAKLKDIPIHVYHGGKDGTVQPKKSQDMVDAIKAAGGTKVELFIDPEAGHDSWTKAYADPALYTWMLEQKRPAKAAEPKADKP
jgi:predicted peptidase